MVQRLALVSLLGAWWFVLQRNSRIVGTVDAVSYLAAVYSAWRATVAALRTGRSAWVRLRRGEVSERGEDGGTVVGLGGDAAQRGGKRGVVGRQDGTDR
jgi:hypothetical protein